MQKDDKINAANQNKALVEVRNRIDEIDLQVLNLLKERLGCAQKIGKLKSKEYEKSKSIGIDKPTKKDLCKQLAKDKVANPAGLSADRIERIVRMR